MGFEVPSDIAETLEAIYKKAKRYNPDLDEGTFMREIIMEWLEPFERKEARSPVAKGKVKLRNNVREAIKFSGKTITQVAEEIGINRVHLSQIINGHSEPSITVFLLLVEALNYPPGKMKDLFYLEPAAQE